MGKARVRRQAIMRETLASIARDHTRAQSCKAYLKLGAVAMCSSVLLYPTGREALSGSSLLHSLGSVCLGSEEPFCPISQRALVGIQRVPVRQDCLYRLASAFGINLLHDAAKMIFDRVFRQVQTRGNFLVCEAFRHQAH